MTQKEIIKAQLLPEVIESIEYIAESIAENKKYLDETNAEIKDIESEQARRGGKPLSNEYGKPKIKYAKESRIIPEDVDNSVISQTERELDDAISAEMSDLSANYKKALAEETDKAIAYYSEATSSEMNEAIKIIEDYLDKNNAKTFIPRKSTAKSKANGVAQKTNGGNSEADLYNQARNRILLKVIGRELEYRKQRRGLIEKEIGIKDGQELSFDDVEKLYNTHKKSSETDELFSNIVSLNKQLGTIFKVKNEGEGNTARAAGSADTERGISYFIDGLCSTRFKNVREEFAVDLVHEMIHQGTDNAKHLKAMSLTE